MKEMIKIGYDKGDRKSNKNINRKGRRDMNIYKQEP